MGVGTKQNFKNHKMDFSNISPFQGKRASPKLQQIIRQAGPSGQLFVTINFAFMKFFDFCS